MISINFWKCCRDILLRVALLACCVTRLVILVVIRDGTLFFRTLENSSRNHKKIVSCINDCSRPNRPRLKFGTVNYFVVRF